MKTSQFDGQRTASLTTVSHRPGHPAPHRAAAAALVAMAVALTGVATAGAQDAINGEQLYERSCMTCHGRDGRQKFPGQTRTLDTISEQEFREFLHSKQLLDRPRRPPDRVKAALTDAEIDALAVYVATFRKP